MWWRWWPSSWSCMRVCHVFIIAGPLGGVHAPTVDYLCAAGLFLAIGNPFLPPHGSAWAILFIWAVAGACGYLVEKVSLCWAHAILNMHATRHLLTHRWMRRSCTSLARSA